MISRFVVSLLVVGLTGCVCRSPHLESPAPPAPDSEELLGAPWGIGMARGHTGIVTIPPSIQQVLYPLDTRILPIALDASPQHAREVGAADFFAYRANVLVDASAEASLLLNSAASNRTSLDGVSH